MTQFLNNLKVSTSQWIVLDAITRALRDGFKMEISLPCIEFDLVESRSEPVNEGDAHGYQYEIERYIGKGYFFTPRIGGKIPLGVSCERTYGTHLPSNAEGAYLYDIYVMVTIDGEKQFMRFSVGAGGFYVEPKAWFDHTVPLELKQMN